MTRTTERTLHTAPMESERTLRAEPTLAVRSLNRALAPLGDRFPSVAFDTLVRVAESLTRLSDWGDDATFERFRRCADAVEGNPNLSTWGRTSLRIFLQAKFVNRLLLVDFVKKHPAVREVPIVAPLVIFGWYRTGTTLLHNLLTADPSNRAPRAWEVSFPIPFVRDPRLDEGLRRAATTFVLEAGRFVIPEQSTAHHTGTSLPEECFFLLESSGASTTLFNTYHAYDYAFSLLDDDLGSIYADHKLQLQVLSLARPRTRFVLKCPFHLWALDALNATYPDALLVQTHRDVRKSLASNCSLSAMTTTKFTKSLDLHEHGRFWQSFYRVGMERGLAARESIPTSRLVDVRTDDLSRDPIGAVRSIYEHFDLGFEPSLERAFAREAELHPQHARGKHVYDATDFGLDVDALAVEYADYHQRFGLDSRASSGRPRDSRGGVTRAVEER